MGNQKPLINGDSIQLQKNGLQTTTQNTTEQCMLQVKAEDEISCFEEISMDNWHCW